jgi:hypothetical protein
MSDLSAFRRSRIYAQGWKAAREPRTGGARHKDVVNPYPSEPEKSRWDEGYANALRSNRQQDWFKPSRAEADPAAK